MKCNVGNTDRILRVILGIVIIGTGWLYGSWWGALGLIPIITGGIGWCPLYIPFGFKTKKD